VTSPRILGDLFVSTELPQLCCPICLPDLVGPFSTPSGGHLVKLIDTGSVALLPDAHQVKEGMRERIRAERRLRTPLEQELDGEGIAAVAQEIPEIARARCVAAYTSTASAPGTVPLRRALLAGGVRVLLPVLLDDGHLDWCVDDGVAGADDGEPEWSSVTDTATAPGSLEEAPTRAAGGVTSRRDGSPHLLGLEGIGQADVVLIPALAIDTLGNRLGQGAGFYDRTLRMIDPTVMVFAVVYEGELLDAAIEPVPAEPHDRRVDAVITPLRCLRFPPRRRG
jgi:5-formyltetrahydrofolate cyclo-ligase